MCNDTVSRVCPSSIDFSSNEFIVYSLDFLPPFSAYLKLKDVMVNVNNNVDFYNYHAAPIENYPEPASSSKKFNEFFTHLDSQSSSICYFIDISSYSSATIYELESLKLLSEYCSKNKDKVFSLLFNTNNIQKAKRIFHITSTSMNFRWTKIKKIPFSVDEMYEMASDFIPDERLEEILCDTFPDKDYSRLQHETIAYSPEEVLCMIDESNDNPKANSTRTKETDKENDDEKFLDELFIEVSQQIKEMDNKTQIEYESYEKPLYKALDLAFSGHFDDASQLLEDSNNISTAERTAKVFFQRYCSQPKSKIDTQDLFIADTNYLVQRPILLMLKILNEIDKHEYQVAFHLISLIQYSGWKKISFVWNALLWNSTMHHPEAAFVCLLSKFLHVNDYRDCNTMRSIVDIYYGKIEKKIPADFPLLDANVLTYFFYKMQNQSFLRSILRQKEKDELDFYSATNDMLSDFSGELYFYCLFSDLFNQSRYKDDADNPDKETNIKNAVDIFNSLHLKNFN